jgi:hypothetical protein
MNKTKGFSFNFLDHFHVHKEVITNKNFALLDTLLCNHLLISRTSLQPIKNLEVGDMYLIPNKIQEYSDDKTQENTSKDTDEEHTKLHPDKQDGLIILDCWQEHHGEIACYVNNNEWHFFKMQNGMMFFIMDEKILSLFFDGQWQNIIKLNEKL